MALRCYVVRPGRGFEGMVPVSLGLWTSAGPVLDDRVVFLDRPRAYTPLAETDGRVAGPDEDWELVDEQVFESWDDKGVTYVRMRAMLYDPGRQIAVGAYYWMSAP